MTRSIDIAANSDLSRVQAAIDELAAIGGGRVVLLSGSHVTGPVRLQDNIELHLSAGAVLSPVPEFDVYASNMSSIQAEGSGRCMIYAVGVSNIAITGAGEIDGGGRHFIAGDDEEAGVFIPLEPRVRVVVFEKCSNVRIEAVTIRDASCWTTHLIHCTDVEIEGYRAFNHMRMPNTDGLVLDGCSRVVVRNVEIRTADDGIVLKTSLCEPQWHSADITIRDCVIESGSCAFKIGTETAGDFDRILVENVTMEACNRGLGILSRDGGHIRDVTFRNIDLDCHETPFGFWGSGEALTITQLNRRSSIPAGKVERVLVENVTGAQEGALNFYSAEVGNIADVTLRNVRVAQRPGKLGTGRQQDIRPTEADLVPSKDAAGRVGAWVRGEDGQIVGLVDYPQGMPGLFSNNVSKLTLEQVDVSRPDPLPQGWNEKMIWIQ